MRQLHHHTIWWHIQDYILITKIYSNELSHISNYLTWSNINTIRIWIRMWNSELSYLPSVGLYGGFISLESILKLTRVSINFPCQPHHTWTCGFLQTSSTSYYVQENRHDFINMSMKAQACKWMFKWLFILVLSYRLAIIEMLSKNYRGSFAPQPYTYK